MRQRLRAFPRVPGLTPVSSSPGPTACVSTSDAILPPVKSSVLRPGLPKGRWWRVADAAAMTCGVVFVFAGTLLWTLQSHGKVDPRDLTVGAATPVDAGWFAAVLLVLVALVASAGLPHAPGSAESGRSAAGQIAASVAAAVGTGIGTSLGNIWVYGPQDRCFYADCWPAATQAAAAAAPGALAALALLTAGLLSRRSAWRMRAFLPAAIWAVALLALRAAWDPLLLPVFQGPPP